MFRISAKYLKENKIIKNSLIVFSGQAAISLIGLANTLLLLKSIGVEGMGVLAILSGYCIFFLSILSFQSYNALIKFGAEAIEKRDSLLLKHYLKQAFLQDLITSVLSFIIGYLCISLVSDYFNWSSNVSFFLKIYVITIPFGATNFLKALFRLNNDYSTEWKIGIITSLLKLIFLSFGFIIQANIFYFVLLELFFSISNSLLLTLASKKALKQLSCSNFLKAKFWYDKEFTHFNFYNNIVSTLDLPTGQLTIFVINKLIGVSGVGTYNLITKLGSLFMMIVNSVSQSIFPELSKMVARKNYYKAEKIIKRVFSYSLITGIGLSLMLLISYKLWLHLFLPPSLYNLSLIICYILFISITGAVSGIHLLFISLNLVKFNLPLVIFSNIIYLLILFYLTSVTGLIGVIIALASQAILIASLKYLILKKLNKQNV